MEALWHALFLFFLEGDFFKRSAADKPKRARAR